MWTVASQNPFSSEGLVRSYFHSLLQASLIVPGARDTSRGQATRTLVRPTQDRSARQAAVVTHHERLRRSSQAQAIRAGARPRGRS